jgi:hypothetical protein
VSVDCNSTYSIRVFQELSQINDVHIQWKYDFTPPFKGLY